MARPRNEKPSLCHHKPTGLAYVRLPGQKPVYCGRWGTQAARDKYDVVVAEWIKRGRQPLPQTVQTNGAAEAVRDIGPTVTMAIEPYWEFAQGYYQKNGKPTDEVGSIKVALRIWRQHYGETPAAEFDSLKLLALQDLMIARGWARTTINANVGRVKRAIKWMVSRKIIPATVWHECMTVGGLEKGRSKARETAKKKPVPEQHIEAVKPWVSRQVWALIQLQLYTGARPGELLSLRKQDIDRTGKVWTAMIAGHKTEHHDHERRLYFGPEARGVLAPFLVRPDDAYLFSPAEAERERREAMHAARKTPEGYGNGIGTNRVRRPMRTAGACYRVDSYRTAIKRACDRANSWTKGGKIIASTERVIPRWHPHRLRHNAATRIRAKYGVEAARLAIGVANMDVAELYAEKNFSLVEKIMAEVG